MRIGRINFGSAPEAGASPLAIVLHADRLYAKGGKPWFCGKCGRWFDHRDFHALGVTYEDHWARCGESNTGRTPDVSDQESERKSE